ncbi:MAG: DUF4395 domain-containing protein [Chloroflexota bacterium]
MSTELIKANSRLRTLFSFPHPVNEYAARSVAAMVFTLTLVIIFSGAYWLLFFLAYGFLARVLTGPKLSLMGTLATKVIAPKVLRRTRLVAGPPKQFAQGVGLAFSSTAIVLVYGFGLLGAAQTVLGVLVFFAGLEAFAGFCAGCFTFGWLMRFGIIPPEVCERCNDLRFPSFKDRSSA